MRPLSLLAYLVLMLTMASGTRGQACPMGTLSDQCRCEHANPGTFRITCSCKTGQDLVISDRSTIGLASTVIGFHIENCNSSVIVKSHSFDNLFNLERISFRNIFHLKLESRSLDLENYNPKDFQLSIDSVLNLSLQKEAVQLEGHGGSRMGTGVTIKNSFVIEMAPASITGSLKELNFENLIFGPLVQTETVDVGSRGCAVSLANCDVSNYGLNSAWLTGHVTHLSLVNNTLTLFPDAFSGITMVGSKPSLTLKNNVLGQLGNQTAPSLLSGLLNLNTSGAAVEVEATNNHVACGCDDLVWLLEEPSTHLKWQVRLSLVCPNGLIKEAIDKCRPGGTSSSSVSVASKTLGLTLILLLVLKCVY
ncbi:uncharacterized protein LOC125033371 [Penaeus chinensis]|uniref:uncharacterized protein LOC125033371 n=1 Tax=Penaeus chinensis TaxID=139456 RepID=UPI001FB7170E|nr:uncharacterized protein LOC125033371 [Penaeus chinensis]